MPIPSRKSELAMPEPEAMKGLQVEELTNLNEYGSKIRRSCRYNMLNTEENKAATSVRKAEMGASKHTLHRPRADKLFVAKKGEEVVGYLAVKRMEGKRAQIRQLWTAVPGHGQRAIAAHLIRAAKHELTGHGYPRMTVERVSPSTDFTVVRHSPDGGRYLRMVEPDTGEQLAEDVDVSAEEENGLLDGYDSWYDADNDNVRLQGDNDNAAPLEKAT